MQDTVAGYVVDADSAPLTAADRRRLSAVDDALRRGSDIKAWWGELRRDWPPLMRAEQAEKLAAEDKQFEDCFQLTRSSRFWPQDFALGFFHPYQRNDVVVPAMGVFQQLFYDQPALHQRQGGASDRPGATRGQPADHDLTVWRDSLREFVMGYFPRVTSHARPSPPPEKDLPPLASYLKPFNNCPQEEAEQTGIRHLQLYYRRLDNGCVGKFWPVDQPETDLRRIDRDFAWIVIKVEVSGFDLEFRSMFKDFPYLGVPVLEEQYGVVGPDLLIDDGGGAHGFLGRFGFAYSLLEPTPDARQPTRSPGASDVGLKQVEFFVDRKGTILVQDALLSRRPQRVTGLKVNFADLSRRAFDFLTLGFFSPVTQPLGEGLSRVPVVGEFDPLVAYVQLWNLATFGFAKRDLCISKYQLERQVLSGHVLKHRDMLLSTRGTWRSRRDWTSDKEEPPEAVWQEARRDR